MQGKSEIFDSDGSFGVVGLYALLSRRGTITRCSSLGHLSVISRSSVGGESVKRVVCGGGIGDGWWRVQQKYK